MIKFTVQGNPRGKERPRAGRHGFYTPSKTKEYEKHVKICLLSQCKDFETIEDQVCVQINAYFPIPKTYKKEVREEMAKENTYCDKKPDFDNVAKIITDALSGYAFIDDKQVCDCRIIKKYSDNPRVDVTIKKL